MSKHKFMPLVGIVLVMVGSLLVVKAVSYYNDMYSKRNSAIPAALPTETVSNQQPTDNSIPMQLLLGETQTASSSADKAHISAQMTDSMSKMVGMQASYETCSKYAAENGKFAYLIQLDRLQNSYEEMVTSFGDKMRSQASCAGISDAEAASIRNDAVSVAQQTEEFRMAVKTAEYAHSMEDVGYELANGCNQLPVLFNAMKQKIGTFSVDPASCELNN